ncbi:hypothetical protein QUF80_06805 [Desulfococcaceae bacterium HSG8]|nr:hypothetical protein [Desulfococcaceae bacterium HSG8]
MAKYDLNKLGSDEFERMCQSLLKEIIGNGTITFGPGKDGAREASFKGKAPYPSQSDQWDGDWMFQVKFHDTQLLTVDKARKKVLDDLERELDKVVNKYRHPCDNYILITNVPFSSVYESGTHDKIEKIIKKFPEIQNVAVWGADDIDGFIEKYSAIRDAYPQFLSPNDVITAMGSAESEIAAEFSESNFPDPPIIEIQRDSAIDYIARKFNSDYPKQMVIGAPQTGKTNLLSQFVRQYSDRTISYFITSSPLTQEQYTFLYSLCSQISKVVGSTPPPCQVTLESLKSLFYELCNSLDRKAKSRKESYYLLIDGLEWALKGKEGSRIIDLFPLPDYPRSPYMIFSCRSDKIQVMPDDVKHQSIDILQWAFSRNETHQYFRDIDLPPNEIDKIHSKYEGTPGHLKIVKDTICTNSDFDLESAPNDLNKLINQQTEVVFKSSDQATLDALKFLAVSPVPLLHSTLSGLTNSDPNNLVDKLKYTGLIRYDSEKKRLEYVNELTQGFLKEKIGKKLREITEQLLDYVKTETPDEEMLTDLLLIELGDYNGLKSRLSTSEVIKTISNHSTGISAIFRRLQSASEMAQQHNDIFGLIKWILGTNAAKSFVSHAVNQNEINALIAIGESQEALRRAYELPEITSKIRLIAKTYSSMKKKGDRVPKEALDSLKKMVGNLKIEEIDKGILQKIALDLFPTLPDVAVSLLEKLFKQAEKQSIVETAIESVSQKLQEQKDGDILLSIGDKMNRGYFVHFISKWLTGLSFKQLMEQIESIGNTKAKEYVIRQWCKQNPKDQKITKAIRVWQDNIVSDRKFVVSLNSLRQLSELIINLSTDDRKSLIEILRVPEFTSIDSPKEEWVGFRLNLAEALFEIDSQKSQMEIEEVYENVLQNITELDEKAFCFAKLLLTVSRIMPDNKKLITDLEERFQNTFDSLRRDTAYQFELSRGTIQTLVEHDPDRAFTVAKELNTQSRRNKAVHLVLHTALHKKGETDNLSKMIKDSLEYLENFDIGQRNSVLLNIVSAFMAREYTLSRPNLETLLYFSKKIKDITLQSQAFGNLAGLYRNISNDEALKIADEAISLWQYESDLKIKLLWGYELVEIISTIDTELAKHFCKELQGLCSHPGYSIAVGNLGNTFKEILDLAIRAIDNKTFRDSEETIRKIEFLIQRIPAKTVQLNLYAQLAASSYRNDFNPCAERIIREKILRGIEDMPPSHNRDSVIEFCLPIIFEYDQVVSKELAQDMPITNKNRAWYSVVLWELCRSYLGDHKHVDVYTLRVRHDFRKFKNVVIPAVSEITHDEALNALIAAISNSIKNSFSVDIMDQTQALELLRILDEIADKKLPDQKNIQHEGYLILAQAIIHGVRSCIYRSLEKSRKKRGLSKQDIRRRWNDIVLRAKNIPNIADRVFVLADIAEHMRYYYNKKLEPAKKVIEEAENQAQNIPNLLDRIERFELIGKSWSKLKEKAKSEYIIKKAIESVEFLKGLNAEQRLKTLVQTAYKLDPNFADKLVSELDKSRYPQLSDNSVNKTLQIEQLIASPSKLNLQGPKYVRENILGTSSKQLICELVSGRQVPISETTVLERWLLEGMQCHPRVSFDIAHWTIENLHQRQSSIKVEVFLEAAELVCQLAEHISPGIQSGMPASLKESFPVLNRKNVVFSHGEVEIAQKWIQNWLSENVDQYLKICDPCFSQDELDYLRYVPENCKIMVITTNKHLHADIRQGPEELKSHWRTLTSQFLPNVSFIVYPDKFEDKLHDRVILSLRSGLSIGQSLNELGKSQGNITVLTEEESKEVENTYMRRLLDSGNFFMEHGVGPPTMFSLCE